MSMLARRWRLALALPAAALLGFFFVLPFVATALDAAAPGAFARVLAAPAFWSALAGSAALTVGAASLSTLVGGAVALHLARMPPRRRAAVAFVIALPLTFSGLIVAYGFILAYGRAGFVTQLLAYVGFDPAETARLLYSLVGLGFTSSYYLVPRVVLLLLPVLVNFDSTQLRAAESLGAGRRRALFDILLPQIAPTILSAFCLCAAVVFGAYGTALALVGTRVSILPLQLYSMISETGGDLPAAAALALLLTAICATILAAGEALGALRRQR